MRRIIALLCALIFCFSAIAAVTAQAEQDDGSKTKVTFRIVTLVKHMARCAEGLLDVARISKPDENGNYEYYEHSWAAMSRVRNYEETIELEPGYYEICNFSFTNAWDIHGMASRDVFEVKGDEMTVYVQYITEEDGQAFFPEMPEEKVIYGSDVPPFHVWDGKGIWNHELQLGGGSDDSSLSSAISESSIDPDTDVSETSRTIRPDESTETSQTVSEQISSAAPDNNNNSAKIGTYIFTGLLLVIVAVAAIWILIKRKKH